MRTSSRIVLMIVTLLASSLPFAVFAENDAKLPELNYYQGELEQEYLPYYRKFAITGSTKLPEGDADVVRFEIKIKNPRKNEADEKAVYHWVRPEGDTTTSFRIIVKPLQSLGKKYSLLMTFYMRPTVDDRTITTIIDTTLARLDTLFSRDELTFKTSSATLAKVTESVLDARPAHDQMELHQLINRNGVYSIEPRAPQYTFDDATSEWLFSASVAEQRVTQKEEDLDDAESRLETYKRDNAAGIEKLFQKLRAEVAAAGTAELRAARDEDVKELEKALTNAADTPDLFELFLGDSDRWKEGIGTIDGVDVLGDLISAIEKVRDATIALKEMTAERGSLMTGTSRQAAEEKLRTDLERSLQHFFREQSAFKMTESSWGNKTEIDRIRLGTTYGVGAVVFNGENGDDTDIFSYIGLKLYLGPVDRRTPKPYPTWKSHWALTFGAIIGNITYEGQTMENAFGNIKPVFGVSYDLVLGRVKHAIGLNAGVALYRQPHVNPFATGEGTSKGSFYFGITFDLDLFNALKGLM